MSESINETPPFPALPSDVIDLAAECTASIAGLSVAYPKEYRHILATNPNHADALHLLGALAAQVGQPATAVQLIQQSIQSNSLWPEPYHNLGKSLAQLGRIGEASAAYEKAIEIKPDYVAAHMALGALLESQGHFDRAANSYAEAIRWNPNLPHAHNSLGNLYRRLGRLDQSIAALSIAVSLKPDYGGAYFNLGLAYSTSGKSDQAIDAFTQCTRLIPNYFDAHLELGRALQYIGRSPDAIAPLQTAAACEPARAEPHLELGNALRQLGRFDAAAAEFERAIALNPSRAEAHNNLGALEFDRGRFEKAAAAYSQAIRIQPNAIQVLCNLGAVLHAQKKFDEAIAVLNRAIALMPDFPMAYSNLGNIYHENGKLNNALAAYSKAIELDPRFVGGYCNLGNVLKEQGKLDEAIEVFSRAIALDPNCALAYNNLGSTLQEQGKLDEAIAAFQTAIRLSPQFWEAHDNYLYSLIFSPRYDAATMLRENLRWADALTATIPAIIPHPTDRDPNRRLRLGYVSADFRQHVAGAWIEALLQNHDRRSFEVFCYSNVAREDANTTRCREKADHWRTITGISDEKAAAMVRADRIDILVDLSNHSEGNRLRLFAWKPAPIQASHVGYPMTTGLPQIDYRITDAEFDPPGNFEPYSAEIPMRLPGGFFLSLLAEEIPPPGPLPVMERGYITFACLNNPAKISSASVELFSRVMNRVDRSRILMVLPATGSYRRDRRAEFEAHGVSADRIEFMSRGGIPQFLAAHQQADIALDPIPCCGGITSCNALLMGLPVVSLAGNTIPSRAGLSVLSRIGLYGLVADTAEAYIEIAAHLAADVEELGKLRMDLPDRMRASTMLNAANHTRDLELAYRMMWNG